MPLAGQTAEVQHEIDRVVGALQGRREAIADAMVAAIGNEIAPYGRVPDEVLGDVRAHCDIHAGLILEVSRADRAPLRAELGFARDAAARRVRQGIPLEGLLQAFRVGHRTVWEAILEEAGGSPDGRDAAIALARPAMQYIDIASTQVAEAYLKEDQRLTQAADRERRDLLEDLLDGRAASRGALAATRLAPDAELFVALIRLEDGSAAGPHALQETAEILADRAAGSLADALVVVRQGEIVAVLPRPADGEAEAAAALRDVGDSLRSRHGLALRAGLSTTCRGFGGVPQAFDEARQALQRTGAARPVVALAEMSPFEYLVASADAGSRRAISEKGKALLEADTDGSVSQTLVAYAAAGLNVGKAAEQLVVHPNTVRYRLRRISDLTGRDTRRFDHLMDLITVIQVTGNDP